MNKQGRWLALALLGTVVGTGPVSAVDLNFSGTLIDKQCTFAQGDDPLEVDMLSRAVSFFHRYPRTETVPFDIVLKNCTGATQDKLVTMTFSGTQTEAVGGVTLLKTDGGTGILIGLESASGQAISVGSPVNAGTITQTGSAGENRFRFGAYAQGPADLSTLAEGAYTATTTFEVTYQ
ncbi:fimbrial protein [Serratia ureilytica]|uniref:fimbrial protein n=1 Tax=Serratia ureilytica TaxID=300181 RepID=UPI0018E8306F|nr:fimbrial protein [Serratia ureilytica]MBJ2097252.1 type 1 fimbrial protein [Serratia ureilytica]MCH9864520.1 type 1 fimbrial protein [Serratia marcescens]